MKCWFQEPDEQDNTYAELVEGTLSWLSRSTIALARDHRLFLNRNLSMLPEDCANGIYNHLQTEQHYNNGFFELVAARALQEMGADIECEPENPVDGSRVDFMATFPDGAVFVEAVAPRMDRELAGAHGREMPLAQLIKDHVPSGWAVSIKALPDVGPDESRRHIKAFLKRALDIPSPTRSDKDVEIAKRFEQGTLKIILIPQSRHDLSPEVKIAGHKATAYFPDDKTPLREAISRKYRQLSNLAGTKLVALNIFSTTQNGKTLIKFSLEQ